MPSIKNLERELEILHSNTIGLFKPHFSSKLELVINENGDLLKTVSIGTLGSVSSNNITKNRGTYKEFPDNLNLSEMKKNPFLLNEFVKSF